MDLGAYVQIEALNKLLEVCDIKIVRLRGLRLMKFEEIVSEEEINEALHEQNVDDAIQWLQQHSWDCWSSCKSNKKHRSFIYGYRPDDTEKEHKDIVDINFSKVHGRDRKILKLKFKQNEEAIRKQYELWNKFVGKDVLYVHARQGGGNRAWCNTNDLRKHKRYLGDCDNYYDNTYCDLYFDISDIKLEDYVEFED